MAPSRPQGHRRSGADCVHRARSVVAGPAEQRDLGAALGHRRPLASRRRELRIARAAPRVGAWVAGLVAAVKAVQRLVAQAFDDVATYERRLLIAVVITAH